MMLVPLDRHPGRRAKQPILRARDWAVTSAVLTLLVLFSASSLASQAITAGETEISNEYPESVTFEIEASSTAGTITSVDINLVVRGSTTIRTDPAEFEPGREVTARYVWRTRQDGIPPGSLVEYTWTIRDDAGNKLTTQPQEYIILDARFDWHRLENDNVVLWWYAGDEDFGQRVFDAAARSLAALQENTEQTLPHRIHVVIYGSDDDFDSWHNYAREWVAGEAYPRQGLTVQIIPPRSASGNRWHVEAMMPHEIAHLFFNQVTDTSYAMSPPTWLNEGFAQYHEFLSYKDELDWVRQLARRGDLIPLRLLSGTFTGDDERISQMYAESLSAVVFLFDRWGEDGMGALLAAYKAGNNTEEALLLATGLTFEEFQQAWWEWLGGRPGDYPTRVPTHVPSTPEPVWTLASLPTAIPTKAPSGPQATPETPVPSPSAARPTVSPVPEQPSPSPQPPTATPEPESSGHSTCWGPLALVGLVASLPLAAGRTWLQSKVQ